MATLEQFQKLGPPVFRGTTDPMAAVGMNSNAIGVNVQVYTISNIMMTIRDRLHWD